jgi:pSer/pThr/pTyr-binding forkhead associated (FHA) protein
VAQSASKRKTPEFHYDDTPFASTLHLVFQIGGERTQTVALRLSEEITVGRCAPETPEVRPDFDLSAFKAKDLGVSRLHAAILYRDKELYLKDLGSRNGTRINGLPLQPNVAYHLRPGEEIELGKLRLIVRLVRAPG